MTKNENKKSKSVQSWLDETNHYKRKSNFGPIRSRDKQTGRFIGERELTESNRQVIWI